ncbi:MAG: SDR family NAD(P)-dependent oxidoreductase [Proteobacteria bacterium]|nr:SDR family NAD(P)-dependent oxidoreductase [Pseudomonadota bacterium]
MAAVYDFTGRTAVVTGGASGIGLACARRLLEAGARTILWDRDAAGLDAAVATLGQGASAQVLDITDENAIAAAASLAAASGPVQILVNSAGIGGSGQPVWQVDVAAWRRMIEINLTGQFLVCRALASAMIASGWGRIVNIASVAGKEGNPNASAYSASKAGLIGFTKSLGKELVGTGVLANCVCPAVIETPMVDQVTPAQLDYMTAKIPMGRLGQPDEVAALVAWLSSEDCSFSTGGVYDISGGRATY